MNLALGLLIEPARAGSDAIGLALIVGVFSYGFSILLYISGAQELGATRSQLLFSTSPIVGMVAAWTLLQEPILTSQLLAAGVIGLGMYLMLTAAHDHEHRHERMHHVHSHRHDDGHHDHVHPGLPAGVQHTHPHSHQPVTHGHPHLPDLHHRHTH
ncbi:MAG: DMT family transporter [Candidatus Eisenbacteria bacterium]